MRASTHAAAAVPAVSQILAEVKCEEHADKFESLDKFLNTSSRELKESGIEQSQQRRLIMKKVEYARQLVKFGQFEKEYPAPPPPPVEEDAGGAEDGAEAATEDA